jgi:L-arabinose isomerase
MRNVAVTEGDKVEAEIRLGVSVNTWGVNDLVAVVDAVEDRRIAELVAEYEDAYDVVPELRTGGDRHDSLREAARIEAGLRTFLTDGGFGAFTTNFEDLGGLRQLPGIAVQRLMADGYGFGGEGDWKTSVLLRTIKAMADGLPGGTSFMEDYTYHLGPARRRRWAPTCSRSARASPPPGPGGDPSAGHRRPRGPVRPGLTAASGPATVTGICDVGDRFRLVVNEVGRGPAGRAAAPAAGGPRGWVPRPGPGHLGRVLADRRRPAPHRAVHRGGTEELTDLAEMLHTELLVIDADTSPSVPLGAPLERRVPPARAGRLRRHGSRGTAARRSGDLRLTTKLPPVRPRGGRGSP